MPPRKKVAPPPPVEVDGDLKTLLDLADEQRVAGINLARKSNDRMNAMWFAKGDSLVLLVSRAPGAPGPTQSVYLCNLVDVRHTT